MSWNYRVVYHPPSKYKVSDTEFDRKEYLAIHEVYYNKDGNPDSMTVDAIVLGDEGEDSLVALKWILEHQLEALEKPILEYELENGIYKEISKKKQNKLECISTDSIYKEKQNDFSKSIEEKK